MLTHTQCHYNKRKRGEKKEEKIRDVDHGVTTHTHTHTHAWCCNNKKKEKKCLHRPSNNNNIIIHAHSIPMSP